MPFSVEIRGASELAVRLSHEAGRGGKLEEEIRRDLGRFGLLIVRYARQNLVPGHGRRTGYLANSIAVVESGLKTRVGPSAHYGAFVEFGTGRAGSSSGFRPYLTGYSYGRRAGMRARPYLKPAYDSAKPEIIAGVKKIGHDSVKRLKGS